MESSTLVSEFISWLKARNTKVAKKTLKVLDKDILYLSEDSEIKLVYTDTHPYDYVPNYVFKQLEIFAHKKGYKLWYEV